MDRADLERLSRDTLVALLELPDHLRRTALVVIKRGRVTAEDVAKETSRARANESGNLNQLERMGYLKRHKEASSEGRSRINFEWSG